MARSRTAAPLGGVHAMVLQRVRRRRRRALSHDAWSELDRSINPAFFRPTLRADLEIADFVRRNGERYTMLKTPIGPNYVRLTATERDLLALMDGTRTVKDLVVGHFRSSGAFSLSSVTDLVEELRQGGFLDVRYDPVVERAVQARKARRSRVPAWMRRFAATRRLDFPGAHRFFDTMYRYGGRFFFTKSVAILCAALAVFGVVAFFLLLDRGKYSFLAGSTAVGILLLYLVDLASTFVHEAGHALSCVHARRRVNAAGFMLYLGMPAFFIETTDTWMADRRKRMVASAGGPFIESVSAGAAAVAALFLPVSALTVFLYRYAVLAYIGIVQNLVPFLRLDGYYILMDAMEEVNLREKAFEFVREDLPSKLKRRESFSRNEKIYFGYGVLAVVFTILAVVLSTLFWSRIFSRAFRNSWNAGWPSRILITVLIALILAPIVRALLRLARTGLRHLRRLLRVARRSTEKAWRAEAVSLFRELPVAEPLDDHALDAIGQHVRQVRVSAGQAVVKQGERGTDFFVVRRGTFEISQSGDDGVERVVRRVERGRSFGEIALLEGTTRTASVRSLGPGELFALDKGTFDRVFAANLALAAEVREQLAWVAEIRDLPIFAALDDADAARLLQGASWRSFAPGDRILKQGDEGDAFYAIVSGQVDVIENRRKVARLGAGAYFGEIALLTKEPRSATVRAATPVRALELERKAFDRVLAKSFRRGRLAPSRALAREWEH